MKQLKKTRLALSSVLLSSGLLILALGLSSISEGGRKRSRGRDALPSSGTLTPSGPQLPWDGNWVGTSPGGASPEGETSCVEGVTCEKFALTLSGVPGDWFGKTARITISAADPALTDYDVYIHQGTSVDVQGRPNGPLVGSSGEGGTPPEVVDLDPNNPAVGTGDFLVHVVYWAATAADQYSGSAAAVGGPTPTPTPSATPTPTPVAGVPRFYNYYPAQGVAEDAGEPTIGSNWNTEQAFSNNNIVTGLPNPPIPNGGTANYYGGFLSFMLRARFNDCSSPADPNFEQMPVTLPATTRVFGDPILFTDHFTGRTFVSQLEGLTPAGSTMEYTDDDGDTFCPSEGGAPSGLDHQTIGGGPFAIPTAAVSLCPTAGTYPNAVYYASQSIADATSQLSLDGGFSFPVQTVMFTAADCAGLHGHLKVAEDGTAFVPDKACADGGVPFVFGGEAAVAVSENNGLTWDVKTVPGATSDAGVDDPSVGVSWCPPTTNPITGDPIPCDKAARSNTIYLGFLFEDGRPGIAWSDDKGDNWSTPIDVGALAGVKHAAFPAVVVGDPDRAAFAFFGTTTQGAYDQPTFPGIWHLYVATTFDHGASWTVQNITPNDPIQRGGICGDGTCRNLLDFFDAVIDKEGRILIAGEDGCIGGCVNGGPNSFTAKAFISRQTGGKRMFSVFDPVEPAPPGAPRVTGAVDPANTMVELSWPVPDHSGSPITSYKIYRSYAQAGPYTLIGTTTEPSFVDTGFDPMQAQKFYRVTAVNAIGEGPYCGEFQPQVVIEPDKCTLPGALVINDVNPDGTDNDSGVQTPVDPRVNIRQLYIAEPFVSAGVEQFFFTLQVAPSSMNSAPPNSQWYIIWNRLMPDATHDRWYVAMTSDTSGGVSFEYGKFGVPLDPMNPSQTANTPMKIGDADAGSFYDPLTGVIRILLSKSKAENAAPGNDLAGLNVRTYFNRPDPGQRSQNNASDITDDSSYQVVGNQSCAPTADLVKAVSRKTHGAAGAFDVKLAPLVPAGATGIECRREAGDVQHVVLTFASPVTFTGVSVSGTHGSVSTTPAAGSAPVSEVTVDISAVENVQTINIDLLGVTTGGPSVTVSVPMGVLIGDTNADRIVNSADISQTKAQSFKAVIGDNFRNDVTVDGTLNSADVGLVKSKSFTSLP